MHIYDQLSVKFETSSGKERLNGLFKNIINSPDNNILRTIAIRLLLISVFLIGSIILSDEIFLKLNVEKNANDVVGVQIISGILTLTIDIVLYVIGSLFRSAVKNKIYLLDLKRTTNNIN